MNLQTELIKEFAEVVHDVSGNKQRLSDNIVYGTLSKEGAHNYVKIDGSDLLTPVVVAASADSGDRVGVIIKNHTAIAGFNFSSPSVNTRTMENLVSTVNGKFDRIDATYITAEKANLTFATIQSLEAVDGKFDNLDTKFLTVESAKLQYATVEKLNATDAKVGSISGDFANFKNGEFSTLKAKQASFESATTENFKATNAKVDNLESTSLKASEAEIKYATIESLNATNAKVKNLDATTLKAADAKLTYATIESLNALKGDITDLNVGSLTARVATIEGAYISKTETKQLLAGYADIKLANVAAGTIGSALIGDGAITDAKIASVSANKLTAGTIDASKINVTNLNADNLTVGTINGQRIGEKTIDLSKLSKEVPTKAYLDSVQNGLQNQIDNAIQTYTTDAIPTLKNSPASSWTDNSARAKHVGDICYVTNAGGNADGYCYRFTNTGTSANPVYEWLLIKDSDVNRALQELVTVNGDISGLKTFQSETSSWRTSTDTEISSVKTRTTTIETTYSTKEETKSAADSAKSSAIESAKGYTDTAKTDAIASAKGYTDTATKDMATSTAVANAKKEAIDAAAKDASSKASAAQSTAISEAAKDATSKADAAKSSAISAAASDATTKANTAKSEAISTAASDATKKANDAKSAAISAASSDATSKANTAKSEAISAAASDATNKANAALNSAKGYADDAVDNIAVGGRNLIVQKSLSMGWVNGSGSIAAESAYLVTDYIDVSLTNEITFQMWMDSPKQVWIDDTYFDADKNYIGGYGGAYITSNYINKKYNVLSGAKYVRFSYSNIQGSKVKLEKGNKATDWTPAPEDIDAAINTKVSTTVFNEVKQTVDANSATITRLSETVTTKADGSSVTALSNTVNSIKQTADSNAAAISGLQTTVNKKADGSTVDTISKTLNTVKQTADSNSANISELSNTVSTKADGSTVTALTTRMSNAEQNLDGFKTTVSKTYVTSQTYNEKVTNLETGISAAKSTANTAKSTADAAATTANAAKSTADTASKTASAAKSTAEVAVSTANTAKNTASSAKSTADSAAATANTAKSTADSAVNTANTAKSTADAAKNSVDGLEVGGRNLLVNSKWCFTATKDSEQYKNSNNIVTGYDLDSLIGKKLILSMFVDRPGDSQASDGGGQVTSNRWGMHGVVVWRDSTGKKRDTTECPLIIFAQSSVSKKRVYNTWEVSPPQGYDKMAELYFAVQMTIKPAANNNSTWSLGYPKLEVGTKPTDWTPAPEDAIDHQYTQYYRSTSTTTPTGGTWQDTVPDLLENTCIWTRQAIVHVGGDIEYSNPVMDSVTKKVVSMSAEVTKTAEGLTSTANKVTTLTNDLAGVSTRLGTAESKISQNADSISAKVSTTDFNTFKASNTTAINDAKSSAISTAASDAATKANNAKSAAISTAASDATTKANNALSSAKTYSDGQIETVNAAITQTNSEISAMKGQIALKVEQTDINKAIDKVTVGGRNLFRKTDTPQSNNDYSTALYNYASEPLVAGEIYTVTICVTPAENVKYFTLYFSNGNATQAHLYVSGTKKQIISKTFVASYHSGMEPSVNSINGAAQFYRFPNDGTVTGNSTIHWVKIEKGNKATDWTPAPEDDEERLSSLESWKSEASLKITKDGIIGTVGSYYATGADVINLTGRVTAAESTIKQQSDSIALTVKKDSVISAINQTSESVKISANKISLTAKDVVDIINSGTTTIQASKLNLSASDVVNIINKGTTKISADKLNLSATDVVNIINKGTTKIEASKLNLSGYVTVSSLSGSGTTTIDGSNIKTGKISTDRLDVAAIFAKEVSATKLHVTGNSKIDGNLVTSGINASNITTGTISTDRLDVAGIFAKDVTATGTITGATLVGSSITTKSGNKGSVNIAGDTISAKYSYASNKTQEMSLCADGIAFGETVKNGNSASTYSYVSLDQNGLYIQDIVHLSRSDAQATFSCGVVATGLGIHGSADISNDLRVYGSMRADGNITTSTIELYAATPFIDFHFDGNNGDYTSRIIELEPGKLNVNGVVCNSGAIWGTNIAIDGPGTFTRGITSKAESIFHTGSYTDPYPGKVCTIKSWGTVASLRFAAKGISNTWLGAAKPDGAAYDTICTDANALVPGWRVRTADGAWVGASYAQDPGFRIYYCNASRLGGSNNGTDAIYTFGASGTFHAKSVSQTSDEREKNIISGITEKYEDLFMRLRPVLFNWKTGTDGIHMGFGAQTTLELAEKCGIRENELAAVHKSKTEEPWSMSYTEIVPLAVQMTQKVTKKTVEQDQKIKILESHIQMLQTALDQAFVEIAKLKKAVG